MAMVAATLLSSRSNLSIHKHHLLLKPPTRTLKLAAAVASENGGAVTATGTATPVTTQKPAAAAAEAAVGVGDGVRVVEKRFEDERWVNGAWDLKRFEKGGETDWDAVIDAGNGINSPFLLFLWI
ncbi:hypothetical protein Droror1_Dr00013291 [Drosera rotundifolia]